MGKVRLFARTRCSARDNLKIHPLIALWLKLGGSCGKCSADAGAVLELLASGVAPS